MSFSNLGFFGVFHVVLFWGCLYYPLLLPTPPLYKRQNQGESEGKEKALSQWKEKEVEFVGGKEGGEEE